MRAIALTLAAWTAALAWTTGQSRTVFPGTLDQHPSIDYRGAALADPVSVLQRELTSGSATLAFAAAQGFLRSLLATLDIPGQR